MSTTTEGTSDHQKDREAKVRALTAATLVLLLATVLVAISAVAYLTLRAANQSEDNGELLASVTATNDRLLDCTEVGGKCFEESNARTGAAVVGINDVTLAVIVAALSCQQDGITEQRSLAKCTARRAEAATSKP